MSEIRWSNEWLEFAQKDLSVAEHLLSMHPIPIEIICFHCQQAAEKMLKAVLVSRDVEPPRTHDLVELCNLCKQIDDQFMKWDDACAVLTVFGVQARYPSNLELNETDMNQALRECRKLCEFVEQWFSTEQTLTEQKMDGPSM